jgi:hypothetical protein
MQHRRPLTFRLCFQCHCHLSSRRSVTGYNPSRISRNDRSWPIAEGRLWIIGTQKRTFISFGSNVWPTKFYRDAPCVGLGSGPSCGDYPRDLPNYTGAGGQDIRLVSRTRTGLEEVRRRARRLAPVYEAIFGAQIFVTTARKLSMKAWRKARVPSFVISPRSSMRSGLNVM